MKTNYNFDQEQFWSPALGDDLFARKEEWRNVVKNLRIMKNRVSVQAHKYHKELFFEGRLHSDLLVKSGPLYGSLLGVKIFDSPLFYHMWYHPKPSVELFTEMINANEHANALTNLQSLFFVSNQPRDFTTDYGLMGGREKIVMRAILPSLDSSKHRKFRLGEASLGMPPSMVLGKCPGITKNILCYQGDYNPYEAGRYLWYHLDYALENHHDECIENKFYSRLMLFVLQSMRLVMNFDERDGPHRECTPVVELRDELQEKFEARVFGEMLMSLWDQEKSRYEAGEPMPTEFV